MTAALSQESKKLHTPGQPLIENLLKWFDGALQNLLSDPKFIDSSYLCDTITGHSQRRYALLTPDAYAKKNEALAAAAKPASKGSSAPEESKKEKEAASSETKEKEREQEKEKEKEEPQEKEKEETRNTAPVKSSTKSVNLVCRELTYVFLFPP